ncbi:MAG: thiamine pyrophosphate-dependent enzyme, partial [Verrucomicrobiota bacterium]
MSSLKEAQKIRLLETMWSSREGDRREGILYRQGKGWFQIASVGHEGLSALAVNLRREDYIFPHYRDRALVMARGMTTKQIARGFFAKLGSSSGGRQLPAHFSSREHNIWSMPSPTGSNLLPACGAAWGMQLDGSESVAVVCVGDAGMRQGEFYEAYTFAVQLSLPVVFVVEDNRYGISTPTQMMNPLRLGIFDDQRVVRVDGRRVDDVFSKSARAIRKARSGSGPTILWCELDRLCSHSSSDDQRQYVSEEELKLMDDRDPIKQLENELIAEGAIDRNDWQGRQETISHDVESTYEEVSHEEDPGEQHTLEELLGELPETKEVLFEGDKDLRIVDALNKAFRKFLEKDRRVMFFGEDVADPMGGVFKLTKGLSADYSDRVFNSPLAEATILGVACGLASYGMRPIFELQFIDFVGPAWNQLVTNLAMLRWRSMGEWKCPAVIYAPYGAYLPGGGPWHSQSNESAFAHIPGLRVVVPSTPEDAAGLMSSALKAEDPTIFLLPKHLLRVRMGTGKRVTEVPFGEARQVEEGWDVTVVAWGNCLEQVDKALDGIRDRVSADVFDLRSIIPWDRESIKASVQRTGRLIVVQEDNRSSSVGQMVIQELIEDPEVWRALCQPPKLISRSDVHIGFNPKYEYACLPSPADIQQVLLSFVQETISVENDSVDEIKPVNGNSKMSDLIPLKVPAVGEGLEEARILKFFKNPGDRVEKDEPLYQLETDKAVVDVESPMEGIVSSWNADADSIVEVGAQVGLLQTEANGVHEIQSPAPETEHVPVRTAVKEEPALEFEEQPLSASQQVLAGRLARAAQVAVPATIFQTVCWESLMATRRELKEGPDAETLTTFSLAAWSVVDALKEHPIFRSSLPKSSVLRVYKNVHLGVAVSLPGDDLTTAVVENAETMSSVEFARRLRLQVERARKGQDQAGLQTSVILTSLTGMKVRDAIPVIVPPAMATLGFSSPYDELSLKDGTVVSQTMLNLSLTIDHRVVNGSAAAAFLNDVKDRIENMSPARLGLDSVKSS